MRGVLAGAVVCAAAAGVAVVVWWSRGEPGPIGGGPQGSGPVISGAGTAPPPGTPGTPAGPKGAIAGGEVKVDPVPTGPGDRLHGDTASIFANWARDSRDEPTFHHCVTGRDVPPDIRADTGMTDAEATVVANVLRGEDGRLAAALREFAGTLTGFEPSAEDVAKAGGYRMLQMVTAHQPLFLEMAPFFQNMDDDTQRAFYEERRPWTDFFKDDTIVIRLCKVVHAVRAESYAKMRAGGVDADTLDRLQARYLLPGHFRYPGNNRFEFGPPLK